MAGDWLKMRHDLGDDPAVIRIAAACRIDEDSVVGKLHRIWSWVDRHTTEGQADGLGMDWVDRTVRCPGFAVEMVRVGWLEETSQGLSFPRFDRHCSDTAKARALTKARVKRFRNAASVTEALPEKRREEIPPPPPACVREVPAERWEILRTAWNAGAGERWTPSEPPDEALERLSEEGWLDEALNAIARLRACKYFRTAVGLPQFCGPRFVRRVLQGRYDSVNDQKPAAARPTDDRRSAAEAAAEWQRAAIDPEAAQRRREYLEAKARRAAAEVDVVDDVDTARRRALESLRMLKEQP
jgi:hypothetical protein